MTNVTMDENDMKIFHYRTKILTEKTQKKYVLLVKSMIELQEFINSLNLLEGRTMNYAHSSGENIIKRAVADIAWDTSDLFAFAYELRK